jgi:hypothetical protein
MIKDMDGFVEAAVKADGRGHFLNRYDGQQYAQDVAGHKIYIYKQ